MTEVKDGNYCSIRGRIPPDVITIKKIDIDGKETGIDQPDMIIHQVITLHLTASDGIKEDLIRCARVFNYIPIKKFLHIKMPFTGNTPFY
jgi:hypothetical protein